MFKNKSILITGGSGSFGRNFAKYILKNYNIKKVVIFSRDELKQFELSQQSIFKKFRSKVRFFLGDIRDIDRLKYSFKDINYIVHAAALKQVDTGEYNPFEFIKTNVIGGQNVIEAGIFNNVEKIIALSTDKASAPINLYGATKLCSDKLFVSANNFTGNQKIKFSVVRYGNVMASRGSVIEKFINLKENNAKKIPITDLNMTRFNITIEDSVKFVINCLQEMTGGEIFVPKISSYRIFDLYKAVAPNTKYELTGVRPGEKIDECLITEEESINSYEYKNYFVIYDNFLKKKEILLKIKNDLRNKKCKKITKPFSYTSNKNKFLTISQIKSLLVNKVHDQ